MRALFVGSALSAILCCAGISAAYAQYRDPAVLTPAQQRAYNACLWEAWIDDWCAGNSDRPTSTYGRIREACIASYGGGRFPMVGRTYANTDDYCWAVAHSVVWHSR